MVITIYAVAFIISVLAIFVLMNTEKSLTIRNYLLMFVSITICDASALAIALSQSTETAILANKFSYLGGCFLPFFMFMATADLCCISIPKSISTVLFLYSSTIFTLSCTIGYNPLYYTSLQVGHRDGYSYLIKTYGPLHSLYSILLLGYVVAIFIMVFTAYYTKRNVSLRTTLLIVAAELVVMLVYVLSRVFHSHVEWMTVAYLAFDVQILLLIRRVSIYDVEGNVINAHSHAEKTAYIVFDMKRRYTGNNAVADTFFHELSMVKVDRQFTKEKAPFLYDNFTCWIMSCIEKYPDGKFSEERIITCNNKELKCTLCNIFSSHRKKEVGYLVEVVDDTEQQKYIRLMDKYNEELQKSVEQKTTHILDMQNKMILGMANMIESRDDNTGGHIKRTSEVVRILVDELLKEGAFADTLTTEYCEDIVKAAPMHDLGKIAVSDAVLKKPGKYDPDEFEIMKLHAKKGADIVETVLQDVENEQFVEISKNIAHYHHERWNGKGYPEGLSGNKIPLEARIMAIADVYDAIVSKRCYKEKNPLATGFDEIKKDMGIHFDPVIGEAFLNCRELVEEYYKSVEEAEEAC